MRMGKEPMKSGADDAIAALRRLLADAENMVHSVPKSIEFAAMERLRGGIKEARRWLKERGQS